MFLFTSPVLTKNATSFGYNDVTEPITVNAFIGLIVPIPTIPNEGVKIIFPVVPLMINSADVETNNENNISPNIGIKILL